MKLVNINNSACYGYAGLLGGGHGSAKVPKERIKLKIAAGLASLRAILLGAAGDIAASNAFVLPQKMKKNKNKKAMKKGLALAMMLFVAGFLHAVEKEGVVTDFIEVPMGGDPVEIRTYVLYR